ncbi:hypothetical protein Q0O45_13190, partial [Staphylococcus aureus]|nr:hypothetical protein [Staphylococcus aureus]
SYWELLPRVVVPAVILMFSLWVGAALPGSSLRQKRIANWCGFGLFAALLATLVAAFFPHGVIANPGATAGALAGTQAADGAPENWEFFGR